jgi:hypothetical protein
MRRLDTLSTSRPMGRTRPLVRRACGALLAGALLLPAAACDDFLDVNDNPNGPETVSANLYVAPMLHWMVHAPLWDGRFVARYTQMLKLPGASLSTWDRMGYDPSSDNGAQQWRDVYWSLGQNLVDMNEIAEREERWDVLGLGRTLQAWGWLVLTDLHGEIIIKEAIDQTKFSFNYDTQEFAYEEVLRLLDEAIELLQRTDGAVDQAYLGRTDLIYNGDRTKWLKFAYGLKALALNHFSNKASYDPAAVIAAVNSSFTSNADDALLPHPATNNNDTNFLGRTRNNITNYRQTLFILGLMDGTEFGGAVDPRMTRMLAPSPDGQYRGMDVNVVGVASGFPTAQIPNNPFGYPTTGGLQQPGRYLFSDKVKMPAMTYAQLQFVKAEAAYRQGDLATARSAYVNGISAHIDFVNARNSEDGQSPTPITAAEKAAFLANTAVVPAAGDLTMTHIMSQKAVAQWAWGFNEAWMDLRRFNYYDIDPKSGKQVFPGFQTVTNLYPDNGGKVVQRIRPRFNSEYVWNRPGLDAIGGLALDYHTKPLWITQP